MQRLRLIFPALMTVASLIAASGGFATPAATVKDTTVASVKNTSAADSSKTPAKKKGSTSEFNDTVHYEAERIDYDAEGKQLTLTGNARIDYQKITLYADTILYKIDQNLFTASGMPQLVESGDTTVGDYMVYNIKTRRGRVNHASTRLSDANFNGKRIIKSDKNELYVDAGDYTTCAQTDTPHFCFYGRHIKVVPEDKIISRPVIFNIGEAPVAAFPFFIFPIEQKRRSGFLTPAWGGNPSGGGYLDNVGYYFAPNDFVDLTVAARVYEFSEFVANASSNYALKYWLNGSLSTRYSLTTDYRSRRNEWAVNYRHDQNLTPDGKTKLAGSGNLVSQKNFYQKFSEDSAELREQNLSANLSFSRQFDAINSRLNVNWDRSHNLRTDMISENLPGITFNVPSRPLIPHETENTGDSIKWFNNIYWGYDFQGNMKHVKSANDSIEETFHPGAAQSFTLSAPQKLFKWITISPNFSGQLATVLGYKDTNVLRYDTTYDTVSYVTQNPGQDSRYSDYTLVGYDTLSTNQLAEADSVRVHKRKTISTAVRTEHKDKFAYAPAWNAGVSMSTKLYGLFPLRIFNFAGIRHTCSPSLSYTFTPEQIMRKEFYDAGITYDRGHDRSQRIGLSLGNQFEGKVVKEAKEGEKPKEDKFTIINYDVNTGYDFEAKHRKWSDLRMSASTGIKDVRVNANGTFWLYDENDNLGAPAMSDLGITLSIGTLGAKGELWGGDLLVLDSLQPDEPAKYANIKQSSWGLSLTPSYTFSMRRSSPTEMFTPNKQYGLNSSANLNFTRNWSLQWNSTYNFQANQWVQNSININCDLECWEMRFQWRPEKLNPGYYFLINIKKIPEIKWEQRN